MLFSLNFVGTVLLENMIESKELAFQSVVSSTSIDRIDSFPLNLNQNECFNRSISFMDIARQTSEHQLSITLHSDDTWMCKKSPALAKRLNKVEFLSFFVHSKLTRIDCFIGQQIFFSKSSMIPLVIVFCLREIAFSYDMRNGWFSLLMVIVAWLYISPAPLIWNQSVIKYALKHSFDLHFILCNFGMCVFCDWVFIIDQGSSTLHCIIYVLLNTSNLYVMTLVFTLEAVAISHRLKQLLVLLISATSTLYFVHALYGTTSFDYNGVEVHIKALDVTISFRDMYLICIFNQTVFWLKKLLLLTKYPNCILMATYPRIVWTKDRSQRTLSSVGLNRTQTMSLDIYKQSVLQQAEIFLFEDNSIAHRLFNPKIATTLHQLHFSKWNHIGVIFAVVLVIAIFLDINILAIVLEICLMVFMVIGTFTFDVERTKFYLKSFDFWYKWFNWTMYVCAYSVWTNHQYDMTGADWVEFLFRNLDITITMFYIFSIDAYHVSNPTKKRGLAMLIAVAVYFHVCIVWQLHFLAPTQNWIDWIIQIPVMQVGVSLRGMMMSSMGNFIVFMIKQLVLMIRHPGAAALELYPQIIWFEDSEPRLDDAAQSRPQET